MTRQSSSTGHRCRQLCTKANFTLQAFSRTSGVHACNWLAKNCVAYFSTSLSSRSTRFSRRRRSFSRAKSACGAEARSLGRYCDTHLPSVDFPIPKSDATRSRGNPLVGAIRLSVLAMPPAWLRSSNLLLELFCMLDHLVGLLLRALIAQVTGANPLQVQHSGERGAAAPDRGACRQL